MAGFISAIIGSREQYYMDLVKKKNRAKAFPLNNVIDYSHFLEGTGNDSILISGGNEHERARLIAGSLNEARYDFNIVLHNGNRYLESREMKRHFNNLVEWNGASEEVMDRRQFIAMMTGDGSNEDLSFFYSFAVDVCEVLGLPLSFNFLNGIDWQGMKWQHDLLEKAGKENAMDLLSRFDRRMAELAAKAAVRMELITRANQGSQNTFMGAMDSGSILVKRLYGSSSEMTLWCFRFLQDAMERGKEFNLFLDDIYIPGHPVILENTRNTRLIMACGDLCDCSNNLNITKRPCSIVVLRHCNMGNAEKISRHFIGEYDRIGTEFSFGSGRNYPDIRKTNQNQSVAFRESRDLRLKPEQISQLGEGEAFIHLANGTEGCMGLNLD